MQLRIIDNDRTRVERIIIFSEEKLIIMLMKNSVNCVTNDYSAA